MSDSPSSRALVEGHGDRGAGGRFLPGNAVGRRGGNPRLKRLAGLQQAVAGAIKPADLVSVLHKLRDQALDGDTQAARLLVERCLGRPREEPPILNLELPDLSTPAGCRDAFAAVAAAVARGDVAPEVGARLAEFVNRVVDSTLLVDLEKRLDTLEQDRHR